MKKIVSLMALCAVLFGAVLMVTGCGNKPAKGTVWKITKITVNGESEVPNGVYFCFHTDGNAYNAEKDEKGNLHSEMMGPDTIDTKSKKLTIAGLSYDYTIRGNNMTIKATADGYTAVAEMQKSSDYTEAQIKAAAKPEK